MNIEVKDNSVIVDGVVYRKENNSTPSFKVGDWAAWVHKHHTNIKEVFRIKEIDKNHVYSEDDELECYVSDLVSVTPEEIESHLRKICDEKFMGKKVKSLFGQAVGVVKDFNVYEGSDYDEMWYVDANGNGIEVYEKGRWAEVLPDKKKLPKTREEFKTLIDLIAKANILLPFGYMSTDEFLDQYDFSE